MIRKLILKLAVAMPLALPLASAAMAQGLNLSGGGPIDVTARGGFEWRENEQKVIASGDARAVRGDVTVIADQLVALYRKKGGPAAPAAPAPSPTVPGGPDTGDNEVYRLLAEGNVRIFTQTDQAVGDRAVYDIDQSVLVMTGKHMKLTTPQDVLTARDSMEYWSQRHMAVGRGDAVVVTTDGRRLSADILVAYTEDPNAPEAAGAAPAPKPNPAPVSAQPTDPIATSGKLKRVEAFGNVEVRTAVDTVRGERGVYIPDTGMARVVGHVRVTHGQNQLNGPAADVNMKTGIAHMISDPGQPVQGLIMPNEAASAGSATPAPRAGKPPATAK